MNAMAKCHPEREIYCRGVCRPCYTKNYCKIPCPKGCGRMIHRRAAYCSVCRYESLGTSILTTCVACKRQNQVIAAHGRCSACYKRMKRASMKPNSQSPKMPDGVIDEKLRAELAASVGRNNYLEATEDRHRKARAELADAIKRIKTMERTLTRIRRYFLDRNAKLERMTRRLTVDTCELRKLGIDT